MTTQKILLLAGDGIGPEVMAEVEARPRASSSSAAAVALDRRGTWSAAAPMTPTASRSRTAPSRRRKRADAVLLGAVGGPKWDGVPYEHRPEAGLLRLRKDLELFANLRPAICYPALADSSALKRELVDGLDIVIVRELTGGVYFGEPKEITDLRQRPEARRRHAGLRDLRDRAHRQGGVRARAGARRPGDLGREAQRHEVGPALEPGRHRDPR